ncbi:peptide-methionine (S)-S-oxide reductase MsrA [Verrucomicrobium sp. BvORR106]|uniref:peptide-methionine (S)-S-oxide reductase MsrA n=1 Tax=Verrucomicrobium sp. BvORR106 TaxID=1403819 RepID=UPI00056E8A9E|nr:peptide-methionine (S)-S-oxide reductase MsrA [Verrucomicrobium sp. BvORR106]
MKFPLLFALMSAVGLSASSAAEPATETKAAPAAAKTEEAIFGGGCFWCTEGCYLIVKGVSKVVSGYTGGHVENPTYKQVCTGETGHAEVIKVTFDPAVVSYKDLVDLFWYAHDPTTLNRQGADVGTQYRSAIYYTSEEQKKIAEASKAEHAKEFSSPIVTEITKEAKFYPAEDYHQNFANNNPTQGYVCNVVLPKVDKFKAKLKKLAK